MYVQFVKYSSEYNYIGFYYFIRGLGIGIVNQNLGFVYWEILFFKIIIIILVIINMY